MYEREYGVDDDLARPPAPRRGQQVNLALRESHIYLLEDVLVREDKHGNEIAAFDLSEISEVRGERRFSFAGLFIIVFGLVLVGVGLWSIAPNPWAWAAYICGGLIALVGLLAIVQPTLVVEVSQETFTFEVQEPYPDLAAFAYSVNQHIKTHRR